MTLLMVVFSFMPVRVGALSLLPARAAG